MPENKFYVVSRERKNAFGETYKEYWDHTRSEFFADIEGEAITNTFAFDEQFALDVLTKNPDCKIRCYSFWEDYKYIPPVNTVNEEQSNETPEVQ